jgi:Peptidase M50B-like
MTRPGTQTTWHPIRAFLLVGSSVLSLYFWDTKFLLPFKLLAVMGHETGHALAAFLVGGTIEGVSLSSNEAGQCVSRIPPGFLAQVMVSSAGYVGASIIGVVLMILTFRFDLKRSMLWIAALWLLVMGLVYGKDLFTIVFCVLMAVLLSAGAKWLPLELITGINLFIASFTSLYALVDLKDDLWNQTVRAQSDAQILSDATMVPAVVWAFIWTAISGMVLLAGAALALRGKSVPSNETSSSS